MLRFQETHCPSDLCESSVTNWWHILVLNADTDFQHSKVEQISCFTAGDACNKKSVCRQWFVFTRLTISCNATILAIFWPPSLYWLRKWCVTARFRYISWTGFLRDDIYFSHFSGDNNQWIGSAWHAWVFHNWTSDHGIQTFFRLSFINLCQMAYLQSSSRVQKARCWMRPKYLLPGSSAHTATSIVASIESRR